MGWIASSAVLGNHDAVIAGVRTADGFNATAKQVIGWTAAQLDDRARGVLAGMPLTVCGPHFRCVHGSAWRPEGFHYIQKESEARRCWQACEERLVFVGHTHIPRLHRLDTEGRYYRYAPPVRPLRLQEGNRYILNVGSVGLSRSGESSASWLLYDSDTLEVTWIQTPYDVSSFCARVRAAHDTPEIQTAILKRLEQVEGEALRAAIDFTPTEAALATEVSAEQHLSELSSRVRTWRRAAVALVAALLLGVGLVASWPREPKEVRLEGAGKAPIGLTQAGEVCRLVPMWQSPSEAVPPGWGLRVGDGDHQRITWSKGRLQMKGGEEEPSLAVVSPAVKVARPGRLRVELQGAVDAEYRGAPPVLVVDYLLQEGRVERSAQSGTLVLRGRTLSKRMTLPVLPKRVEAVRLRIEGAFAGRLQIDRWLVTRR
jgi:diadenosine tetraphosphatase ApaH/serine/threonine PP2A family protein phosphatase